MLYEKYGLAAQVALSFNSPALGSVGSDAEDDLYADWYRAMDLKVSAPIGGGLRGLLEVSNLADQHRLSYGGVGKRRVANERYSWSLYAGIDWRLR